MKLLENIKETVVDKALERCGNCPAYCCSKDYWGEYDEGCVLNKDIFEFCPIALLPKIISKPYVNYQVKKEEQAFADWYEREGRQLEDKMIDEHISKGEVE